MIHKLNRVHGKGTNHVMIIKAIIETYRSGTMENTGVTSIKLAFTSRCDAIEDAYDGIAMTVHNVSDTGALDFARYAGTVYGLGLQLESLVHEMIQDAKLLHH